MKDRKKPDELSFVAEHAEKEEKKINAAIQTQFERFADDEEFKQLMQHVIAYTEVNDQLDEQTKHLNKQVVASIAIALLLFWSLPFTGSEVISESLAFEINMGLLAPACIYLLIKTREFIKTDRKRSVLYKERKALLQALNVDFQFINIYLHLSYDGDEMMRRLTSLQRSKMGREREQQEARQMRLMNDNKPLELTDEGEFQSIEVSSPRKKKSN